MKTVKLYVAVPAAGIRLGYKSVWFPMVFSLLMGAQHTLAASPAAPTGAAALPPSQLAAQSSLKPTSAAATFCPDFGNNVTQATAVSVDDQGNTYVTGGKRQNDVLAGVSRGSAFATVKYDPNGTTLWSRNYQGQFGCFDHAAALSLDKQGNVYVTGREWLSGVADSANPSLDAARWAMTTVKYNNKGTAQWTSTYFESGDKHNDPFGIGVDSQGDIYVTGISLSQTSTAIVTVKYDGKSGK